VGAGQPSHSLVKIAHSNTLEELSSELELIDFQEKSGEPENLILAPRLALLAVEAATAHILAPHRTTLEYLPNPDSPSSKEKHVLQHPSRQTPCSPVGRGNIPHSLAWQP
jgi:hypothetical protein